jgi:hypothetical protein
MTARAVYVFRWCLFLVLLTVALPVLVLFCFAIELTAWLHTGELPRGVIAAGRAVWDMRPRP